jgi:hypothetical protein
MDIHKPTDDDIPADLHSDYEERAFVSCTRCGETLADFEEGYQLSKVYRAGETILEYALCYPCIAKMAEEFSEESRKAMDRFYSDHLTTGLGLGSCAVCGLDRSLAPNHEFSLGGICRGHHLMEGIMLCGPCVERANEVISKKTRDVWRRFIDENFPGVPADALPSPTRVPVF